MKIDSTIKFSIVIILFFAKEAPAQQALYLKPHFGIQSSLNHTLEKHLAHPEFRLYNIHLSPDFGLQLQFDPNEKWSFSSGIQANRIKIDFRSENKRRTEVVSVPILRIPIGLQTHLKTFKLIELYKKPRIIPWSSKKEKYEIFHVFWFHMRLNGGVSLDYFPRSINYRNDVSPMDDQVLVEDEMDGLGYSVFGGIALQFFNYQRNHFQLSFLYSQGINRKLTAEIDYSINNNDYQAVIGSRSSCFAVQLAYPFKLVSFKNKSGL